MKEAVGTRRRVLKVQQGVVVPPVVLRRLLPDIASIVKDAMIAGPIKLVQNKASNPEDRGGTCKPQDAGDTLKPQDAVDTSKPQDTESTSKPRTQKNILNPFPCDICKLRFPSRYTLNTHLLSHEYMCHVCKVDFDSKKLLLKHRCLLCKICNKPSTSFNHNNCTKAAQHVCKMFNETFEHSLAATSHITHGAPIRSYTRKPKAVNAQENRMEPVNIVKGQKLSDVPIELDGDPEPQDRVNVKDSNEERWLAKDKKEPCYKRSNKDFGRDGVTEPNPRCVIIKLDVDGETRNSKQKGLYIGGSKHLGSVKVESDLRDKPNDNFDVETYTPTALHELLKGKDMREAIDNVDVVTEESSKLFEAVKIEPEDVDVDGETRNSKQKGLYIGGSKHLGSVKVESDLRDKPNDNFDVETYTPTALHELLKGKDMREAIDNVDLLTEESSKFFEAVKIEPDVRLEIKKKTNERLKVEVMGEKQAVKAYTLGLSNSELYAEHQIEDGITLSPGREKTTVCTGKNAMTADASEQVQFSTCNSQDKSKLQDTDDTSKSQDAENTSKLQDTNNKCMPFPCNICKLRYPTRHTLNTHLLTHQHKCRKCKIDFGSKELLLKHKCCVCKVCNKPRGRSKHKKCPKVFTCKCGEIFTRKGNFTIHQKIHAEIYGACPICSKQFTNRTDLINHANNMKFPCIYCDVCFPDSEGLLAHIHTIVEPELPKYTHPPQPIQPTQPTTPTNPPKYSCKMCNEIFEDSLDATSHSRTHGSPLRSYTRKPKTVNAQENRRESVNLKSLSDLPIELNGKPEPQKRVDVKDGHAERRLSKDKKEPCYKRSNEDFGRDGVTEPKLRCVEVELDVDEETRNPNQKGLFIGDTSQHFGGVQDEPDLRDKPNDNCDVVTNTSVLCEPLRDKNMREAVDNVDVMTLLLFEIENEVRREIKKEPNERLESVGFDEVIDEEIEKDVKAWSLNIPGLHAGHQIVDGVPTSPTTKPSPDEMLEPCSVKVEPVETLDEIEAVDVKSEDVY